MFCFYLVPKRCCVPKCNTNFDCWLKKNAPLTAFKFPKDPDLRVKWLKAIPRQEWTPTEYSYVCILHFVDEDVHKVIGPNSHRMMLKKDAVPRIFKNLPARFSKPKAHLQRHSPNFRRERVAIAQEKTENDFFQADQIKNFDDFKQKYASNTSEWSVFEDEFGITLYICNFNVELKFSVRVTVNSDLKVIVYIGKDLLLPKDLKWLLSDGQTLSLWTQFINLLSHYKHQRSVPQNAESAIIKAIDLINTAHDIDERQNVRKLFIIIKDQLQMFIETPRKR